jgi:hypothetical protein
MGSGPSASNAVPEGAAVPATHRRGERDLLRLGVGGAVLSFVMLATLYVYGVPTYWPQDEASHVAYARELSHGRLPTIETPMSTDGDLRLRRLLSGRDETHRTIWTANHPPLYYTLAAVPLRIGTTTAHPIGGVQAARLLSVGLAAFGLVALAYTIMQLAPGRPQLAVAATGLAALVPCFVSVSSMVYNDSLAFLTSTAALAASVVFVVRGPSPVRLAAVGAIASLAALTRASGLLVVGVAGLAVLVGVWRAGEGGAARRLGRAAVWAGALGVAVVGVVGWFYLRNLTLYGDLTGSAALLQRFGRTSRGTVLELLTQPGFWRVQQQHLWNVAYIPPRAGGSLTRQLWLLGLLPLTGLLLAGERFARGTRRPDPVRTTAVGLCVLLLGLLQLSVVQFVRAGGGAHVRYLFPGLVTIALAGAIGLLALPGGRRGLPAAGMLVAMAAGNLWVWWRYLDAIRISNRPAVLVAAVPLLLVGLGLQAFALWRLASAARPDARSSPNWPATERATDPLVPREQPA